MILRQSLGRTIFAIERQHWAKRTLQSKAGLPTGGLSTFASQPKKAKPMGERRGGGNLFGVGGVSSRVRRFGWIVRGGRSQRERTTMKLILGARGHAESVRKKYTDFATGRSGGAKKKWALPRNQSGLKETEQQKEEKEAVQERTFGEGGEPTRRAPILVRTEATTVRAGEKRLFYYLYTTEG